MNNTVSVVIPTYNREKSIVRAVESVLGQTYRDVEVIVVDDCSKDNTASVMKEHFENDNRVIYYIQEKNAGACAARNKGVQLATGKYVAFLDSDDEFLPEKIEKQLALLDATKADLCASDYTRYSKDGGEELVKTYPGTKDEVYNELLYCNFITTGTLIGYKDCFIEVPFDESLPRYQDWDLVLRLCKKYTYCFLEESTLLQYYQPVSITASTNHAKTLKALKTVYTKNIDGYESNSRSYSQICWLMGLHSLYVPNERNVKAIWKGATAYHINVKRIFVFIAAILHMDSYIEKYL